MLALPLVQVREIHNRHSLWTVAPTNFISMCVCVCVCIYMCVCLFVSLSRIYGLYLAYYESDFDQTWCKCWNFDPIDRTKIA